MLFRTHTEVNSVLANMFANIVRLSVDSGLDRKVGIFGIFLVQPSSILHQVYCTKNLKSSKMSG